jgi:hypothetical protein
MIRFDGTRPGGEEDEVTLGVQVEMEKLWA